MSDVRVAVTRTVAAVALLGVAAGAAACSSDAPSTAQKQSNLVACAAVDAVYNLISRHDSVPAVIAQRVVSAGKSADDAILQAHARALQANVAVQDGAEVEQQLTYLGTRCNQLGVGPATYH